MRTAALILVLGAVAATLVVARSAGTGTMRVNAVFDTAKGIVPGQVVKVAGVRVGEVSDVDLHRAANGGYRAVMEMDIDSRFAPFRADARCRILPEGLISENYVECSPGTSARSLTGPADTPTVPVQRTATPLSLQDVINVFSMPTAERLRLVINELGIGTAGRGQDLNGILRRANPALTQAQRVLSIVEEQADELGDASAQTDRVLAQLANRSRSVRRFVDRGALVARTTAEHNEALGESVRRLPSTLRAVDGALGPIDRLAARGTPLLRDLEASAPGLIRLTKEFPKFADAATPALARLGTTADIGSDALVPATPVIRHLRALAKDAGPVASLAEQLLVSLRDQGGIEGLLKAPYDMAVTTAPYDEVSHFIQVLFTVHPECIQANTLDKDVPGCSHRYSSAKQGRVPLNDPTADPGPLTADMYRTNSPGGNIARPRRPLKERQMKRLLEYFLK